MTYELYIEIDSNGNCINHPILGDNLSDALGIDLNNLPPNYVPFIRIPQPSTGNVFVEAVCSYGQVNGAYQDIWTMQPMSDDQISAIKTQIDEQVATIIANREQIANTALSTAQLNGDSNAISVWTDYINTLSSFTITDYNNISIPKLPKLNANSSITTGNVIV